jgi:hypothetical protein
LFEQLFFINHTKNEILAKIAGIENRETPLNHGEISFRFKLECCKLLSFEKFIFFNNRLFWESHVLPIQLNIENL